MSEDRKTKKSQGVFISFEGPEGSGKSTQALKLADRLRDAGFEIVQAREPGGTPVGEAIRQMLQHSELGERISADTEAFLFATGRAQLVKEVFLPALKRGAWVVCDRFVDSTTAYQGFGRGLDIKSIVRLNKMAVAGTMPDITFLLDVEATLGLNRVQKRNEGKQSAPDRFEREAVHFHEAVRSGYLEIAAGCPDRIKVIDASRDEDTIASEIWGFVRTFNCRIQVQGMMESAYET